MDFLSGIFKVVTWGIGVKAETDVWNSHSDDFKNTMLIQLFFGLILGFIAWHFYTHNPVGSANSTLPVLFLTGYVCVCLVLNSMRNLQEKPFMSQNFSEYWLFGFAKGDDYIGGVIAGSLGLLAVGWCVYSVAVLHQSMPISLAIGGKSLAPQAVQSNYVVPVQHYHSHHVAAAHYSAPVRQVVSAHHAVSAGHHGQTRVHKTAAAVDNKATIAAAH